MFFMLGVVEYIACIAVVMMKREKEGKFYMVETDAIAMKEQHSRALWKFIVNVLRF